VKKVLQNVHHAPWERPFHKLKTEHIYYENSNLNVMANMLCTLKLLNGASERKT
jgi:hypothetical protein